VDLNIEGTIWPIDKTIDHLKQRGVRRVFVALGSPEAATIARIRKAEGVVSEKIPEDLAEYRHLGRSAVALRSSPYSERHARLHPAGCWRHSKRGCTPAKL